MTWIVESERPHPWEVPSVGSARRQNKNKASLFTTACLALAWLVGDDVGG